MLLLLLLMLLLLLGQELRHHVDLPRDSTCSLPTDPAQLVLIVVCLSVVRVVTTAIILDDSL